MNVNNGKVPSPMAGSKQPDLSNPVKMSGKKTNEKYVKARRKLRCSIFRR